jgi:hypothetical protein
MNDILNDELQTLRIINEFNLYTIVGSSAAFEEMRRNIARENNLDINEIRRYSNYFAPDRWVYMEDGATSEIWKYSRERDGEVWSAFLARDIKKAFVGYVRQDNV